MSKTNKFAIIVSFFALWINANFSPNYQQLIGFVVIFLFGILHGSNDLALYNKINDKKTYRKIVTYYVLVVFFGVILFYSIPSIALLIFIIISSYHFGEQHWGNFKEEKEKIPIVLFQTIYGLFILSMLFYFHDAEVKLIVSQIIKNSIQFVNFKITSISLAIGLLLYGFYVNKIVSEFKNEIVVNIFYLIVFAIIFKTATLIWAFAIYFVVWHSIPSIKEQINYLYGDFNLKNFKTYFKSAFPYWIISLLGIMILYFIFKDKELFNALFFSFLAAITFPHTIIIIKMQNSK